MFCFSLSVANPCLVILHEELYVSSGRGGLSPLAFSFYSEKHEVHVLAISKSSFGKIAGEE